MPKTCSVTVPARCVPASMAICNEMAEAHIATANAILCIARDVTTADLLVSKARSPLANVRTARTLIGK